MSLPFLSKTIISKHKFVKIWSYVYCTGKYISFTNITLQTLIKDQYTQGCKKIKNQNILTNAMIHNCYQHQHQHQHQQPRWRAERPQYSSSPRKSRGQTLSVRWSSPFLRRASSFHTQTNTNTNTQTHFQSGRALFLNRAS